jgi:hypothetical protein
VAKKKEKRYSKGNRIGSIASVLISILPDEPYALKIEKN